MLNFTSSVKNSSSFEGKENEIDFAQFISEGFLF